MEILNRFMNERKISIYKESQVLGVLNFIRTTNKGRIISARRNGNYAGVIVIVQDGVSAYNLISFTNPLEKENYTTTTLLWEAINYSLSNNLNFDFEGSMIANIEIFLENLEEKENCIFL